MIEGKQAGVSYAHTEAIESEAEVSEKMPGNQVECRGVAAGVGVGEGVS
jgi:hypothetical protein